MKKLCSLFLVLALVLSMLPLSLTANASPEWEVGEGWSYENGILSHAESNANWNTYNTRLDNTRDYEISFDLGFINILEAGNDAWADTMFISIYSPLVDNYLKIEYQSYRNGGGNYQLASSAQAWNGTDWSDRPFEWSEQNESPLDDLHVTISHKAETNNFSWKIVNNDDSTIVKEQTSSGTMLPKSLKACKNAIFTFSCSAGKIRISDFAFGYNDDESVPDKTPITFGGEGDWLYADFCPDNTKSYTINADIHFGTIAEASVPGTWADTTTLCIRNETADEYINFCNQAFFNGNSKYQCLTNA